MPLHHLKDIPLPTERSSRFLDITVLRSEFPLEQLEQNHARIAKLEISDCLHPDVRDYFVRLANVFSLGALYYPLYTICAELSLMALELALNTRFRFETRYGLGLRGLLEHATNVHLLKFEKTAAVKEIHRKSIEFAAMIPRHCEPKQISEIARNRGEMLTKLLPQIRNSSAHPAFASLVDPLMACKSLQQSLELANIVFEESEHALKRFVEDAAIRMDEVTIIEMRPANPCKKAGFCRGALSTKLQACQAIEKAARAFGITHKASISFRVLDELNLVPNAAKDVVEIFYHKLMNEDLLPKDLSLACSSLLDHLAAAESRFTREMVLDHKGREICVRFERSRNACRWVLNTESENKRFSCAIGTDELSFFAFLKAGVALTQEASTGEIRGLSTILGQKPDALDWYQLFWPIHSNEPKA